MRRRIGRIGDLLAAGAHLAACSCLAAMSAVVVYGVAARYLLGSAPAWSEELPRLLLIWGALLGAVVAEREASHLTAGLFPLLVKDLTVRRAVGLIVGLLTPVVYLLLCVAFFQFTGRTLLNTMPALQISVGYIYSAGVAAFALLAIVGLINIVTRRAS